MQLDLDHLLDSPEFYPLKFEGSNLVFVRMSRPTYLASTFTLPSRISTLDNQTWSIPFAVINEALMSSTLTQQTDNSNVPVPGFIFQMAHCGSTLLSKALDQNDKSLVIREPYALRQFAAAPIANNSATIDARRQALSILLTLYGRRFNNHQRVIIKGNVPVNFIFEELMHGQSKLNAVCLYTSFENYISAALKSTERQSWAIHVVNELEARIKKTINFSAINALNFRNLNAAQSAAILWHSQRKNFKLIKKHNSQIKLLDAEHFYTQPFDTLKHCAGLLDVSIDSSTLEQTTQSDLFTRHAKNTNQSYDNQQRIEDQQRELEKFFDDIDFAKKWSGDLGLDS